MNAASQTSGPSDGKAGKPDATPRPGGKARSGETTGEDTGPARKGAGKAADKAAPKTAAASAKPAERSASPASAAPSGPGSGPKAPAKAAQSSPPEKEADAEKTEKRSGAGNGNGNGSPPGGPEDGVPGPRSWPWARIGSYGLAGLAGLAGGAVVAVTILLADAGGGERMKALQTRVENIELASGEPRQVAAMRRRVEELGTRIEALANLSASEPLVRQISDISAAVTKLQGLVEELDERAGGQGPVVSGSRNELRANLEQIDEELVRLDTKLSKLAGDVTRTGARLSGRLEALEAATPEELPKLLDQWSGKVDELKGRVAQLERDEMTRDVRRASMALALANLTRATETSQPFVIQLKAIEVLDPGNRLVDALKPYAEKGLPSVPALTGRFDKVADGIVRVWREKHQRGVFQWLWDSLVGLFSIRPVGEVEGAKAPAIVARAEQRLKEGELQKAVDELSKLGEPEQAAAAEWLETARARIRLDTLVAEVNLSVLEEIAEAEAERKAREAGFVPAEPAGPSPAAETPRPAQKEQERRPGRTPGGEPDPDTRGGTSETQGGADGASER